MDFSRGLSKELSGEDKEEVHYSSYLQLDKVLNSQLLLSEKFLGKKAHDEHLFIVIHQAYELWFKQILFEIESVCEFLMENIVDEKKMLIMVSRLNRVIVILRLLVEQVGVLETMAPQDFIEFRDLLAPASGFQSLQFRILECRFGLTKDRRIQYGKHGFKAALNPDEIQTYEMEEKKPSVLELVRRWLERTPGLEENGFNFPEQYKKAVEKFLQAEKKQAGGDVDTEAELMKEWTKNKESFDSVIFEDLHNKLISSGDRNLSHKAMLGALMIFLYREEPRFHQPYQFLISLQEIDSLMTKWRYAHVMLVQRQIGNKMGTGGSSGYHYLRSTISDRYKVFVDLFNLASFLIPLEFRPPLTDDLERKLSIHLSGSAMRDVEEMRKRFEELKQIGEKARSSTEREIPEEIIGTSV
ncbi:tryptophan 2,3-dioxygenase-like isoform X2 [Dysidea avara]|uniref:tryptophan 2,3-dioxygenase-like isoform X2 n=1 Tax=Dysidea avara TaxID=196820 RepID=UPI0033309C8A